MLSYAGMLTSFATLNCILMPIVHGEYFSSIADMEELFHIETHLIVELQHYITKQEGILETLRRNLLAFGDEHKKATPNIQKYLSNPINAYLVIKRFMIDWNRADEIIRKHVGAAFIGAIMSLRNKQKFPTAEDLNGATVALTRLQITYQLDTADIVRGVLNGVQYNTSLSADDCYELGLHTYMNGYYNHSVLWLQEAMNRLQEDEIENAVTKSDILEGLALTVHMQGDISRALSLTNELLELVPNYQSAQERRAYYEKEIQEGLKNVTLAEDDKSEIPASIQNVIGENEDPPQWTMPTHDTYERLCRGELSVSAEQQRQLKCQYTDRGIPFLKIGRLKKEDVYLDPPVVVYHDVMYDDEIETLKRLVHNRFKRSGVVNPKTKKTEVTKHRISKQAWLYPAEHEHVIAVNRRVEHMTSMSVVTAEHLQIANYGIGGYFAIHYDFAQGSDPFADHGEGNRIATVLFYMSDVDQAGATVFPSINVTVWPKKGSALFWYNLDSTGNYLYKTDHAACPVLAGSKWVANKWLHEHGQEFLRPCPLEKHLRQIDIRKP